MTNEPSPRPWRVEENVVGWTSFIVDANGDGVAACWRTARGDDEKERQYNEANARLIVAAVNGRAALAAVLRDMEEDCEAAWEGTPLRRALAKYVARLCEIAGEGETPKGKGVGW